MKACIGICVLLLFGSDHFVFARESFGANWIRKNEKFFIENKGQFRTPKNFSAWEVRYGANENGTEIYFSPHGVVWRLQKVERIREETEEYEGDGIHQKASLNEHFVGIEWQHANPHVQIIGSDPADGYYNFMDSLDPVGKSITHAYGYRKLLYKDLYPHIDVEYTFHPDHGIKYSVYLHPGADPSQIVMHYHNAETVSKDSEGNIHIGTKFGDMIDHAPVSYLLKTANDKSSIPSSFILTNNSVHFQFSDYDNTHEYIIDPWIIVPVELTTNFKAFEVESDSIGNVYVYGGYLPYKVVKYDPAGNHLWTFSTSWGYNSYFGDLVVDPGGNAYITSAFGSGIKLNSTGNAVVGGGSGGMVEPWVISFNWNYTKLLVGGYGADNINGTGTMYYIDMQNGKLIQGRGVCRTEIRSMCIAPDDNIYALTCFLVPNYGTDSATLVGLNQLVARTSALDSIYTINSNYAWEEPGVTYTNSAPFQGFAGQNGIAADYCYLYTTNGTLVERRNKKTGAVINFAVIPGGTAEYNSGIIVDSCGYIYVGSQSAVYKYDQTLIAPIAQAPTPGAVYDIALGRNGEILAAGNNFVASLSLDACGRASSPAKASAESTAPICQGDSVQLHASGGSTASYSWSPATGLNNPNIPNPIAKPIVTTTYKVSTTIGDCISTDTVTVVVLPLPPANAGSDVTLCKGGSAQLSASGGVSYVWKPQTDLSNPFIANPIAKPSVTTSYVVKVTGANGCTNTDSVTVTIIPSTYSLEPSSIDLGRTNVGSKKYGVVKILNPNPTKSRVRKVWFQNPGFKDSIITQVPFIVSENDSFEIHFSAAPTSEGTFTGELCVDIDSACVAVLCVSVRIEGVSVCLTPDVVSIANKRPGEEFIIPIIIEPSTKFATTKKIDVTVKYDRDLLRLVGNPQPTIGKIPFPDVFTKDGEISFTVEPDSMPAPMAAIAELPMMALLAPYTEGVMEVSSSLVTLSSGEQIEGRNCPATFSLDSACINPSQLQPRSSAEIEGIYPNPSYTKTTLAIVAKNNPHIRVEIFDTFGRQVEVLHDGSLTDGKHELTINIESYATGIYFCRMIHNGHIATKAFNVER